MAFQFDFTADFYTLDNLQPLTLRVAGQPDQAIPAAQDHPADLERPRPGRRQRPGRRPLLGLADRRHATHPPLGAVLIDSDGTAWTILAVTRKGRRKASGTPTARNLAIVNRLDNVAQVWKATYAKVARRRSPGDVRGILDRHPGPLPADRADRADPGRRRMAENDLSRLPGHGHFRPGDPRRAGLGRLPPRRFGRPPLPHHAVPAAQRIDVLPLAVCVLIIEGSEGGAIDRVTAVAAAVAER